jgi:hypothetical protein
MYRQNLSWFPFNKARELSGLDEEDEEDAGRVNRLTNDVKYLFNC